MQFRVGIDAPIFMTGLAAAYGGFTLEIKLGMMPANNKK